MDIDFKNYEVISFDIFDTLIRRKYTQPKDLFKHVGAMFNDNSFAQKRILAEINARKNSKKEDITIDEIYAQLPAKYTKYKKEEKELEINNSFADTKMKKVYDTALSLGKKVIATSDMYLDEETILKILSHAGYTNLNKIYISGIYKKTKGSGKLFDTVIKDLKIKPEKILHIGDNYNSDYLSAKNKGLNAFHYKTENLLTQKKFQKFKPKNKALEKSCFYALLNNYYKNTDNYWQKLGYTYGGPLCYAFVNWLYKELEKQDFNDVLFISRDAWILKEVFEVLYPKGKFKTHYIYASRQICKNVDKAEYQKYLEKEKIAKDKIALVDTITYEYTAQKFLQQFFTSKITGFYWRLLKKVKEHKAFDFEQNKKIELYEFMEFMMTAPENPAVNIKDGQVIFAQENDFEKKRKNIYLQVSKGILDFAKEYKEICQNNYLNLDKDFVIDFTNTLFKYLDKEDVDNLSSIYHTANHAEGKYLPLLPKDFITFSKWHYPPFLYLQFHFDAIRLKLFNKLTIVKKKSNPREDKYYLCNILVKRKNLCDDIIIKRSTTAWWDIKLKNNAKILKSAYVEKDTKIGKFSYLGKYSKIDYNVEIGNYCSISDYVLIGATKHPKNWLSTSPFQYHLWLDNTDKKKSFEYALKTKIGNDVWVGTHAVIMTGVSIGNGAIIGAGAVVCKDIPPYAIAAGVPAKIIGYRFEEDIIKELQTLQWWNLPHKEVAKLPLEDIKKCLKILKNKNI